MLSNQMQLTTPACATPYRLPRTGFGLFPVRSPLLRESLFNVFSSGYLDGSLPQVSLPCSMYSSSDDGP